MEPIMLTMKPQDDSLSFNATLLEALGHPRQVQLLINDEAKMLVLRACAMDDEQAVVIPAGQTLPFEIGGRLLLKRIRKLTGWLDDVPRVLYGEYFSAHRAVRFNLMAAKVLPEEQRNFGWPSS